MTKQERSQIRMVKQNPYNINKIKNPSEKAKLLAVQKDGWAIAYLTCPSQNIQFEAVKQNPFVIASIDGVTQETKELAAEKLRERQCSEAFIQKATK